MARALRASEVGTLLFDLLTEEEEQAEHFTRHLRFDLELLAQRLVGAIDWVHAQEPHLTIGYFGSSTGGGAALVAEVQSRVPIGAIVSRGGRPDLAGKVLARVKAPTLLVVGANDREVITLNEEAFAQMRGPKELRLVPGATHLFEEPGTLEEVARLAGEWFGRYLAHA